MISVTTCWLLFFLKKKNVCIRTEVFYFKRRKRCWRNKCPYRSSAHQLTYNLRTSGHEYPRVRYCFIGHTLEKRFSNIRPYNTNTTTIASIEMPRTTFDVIMFPAHGDQKHLVWNCGPTIKVNRCRSKRSPSSGRGTPSRHFHKLPLLFTRPKSV